MYGMEGLSAKQLGVIRSFSRTFQAKLCKFATGAKPAHIKLLCHSRSTHLRLSSGCPRLSSGCSRSHSRPIRLLVFTGFDKNVPAYPPHSRSIRLFNFTGSAKNGLTYPPHSHPIRLFNFTGFDENVPAYPPPAKNAAACF